MNALRIAAADLSIASTGFCRSDDSTGLIQPKQGDGDRRLTIIRDILLTQVADADVVVMEDDKSGLRGHAANALLHLQGVVRAALLDCGIPYALVTPSTLKLFATGSGNATKADMAVAALKRAGREFDKDKTGDQCDAWWLRRAGLAHYCGTAGFDLPERNRVALGKAVFPETGL
jgi:Holliday junction resolvasome RuvABC endonuclease subunit